jgi:phosphatidylglycerol---prolipoprotein diacylglyceryl transferase
MRPVLFQWRGVKVWSYPAMLYVGLLLGVLTGNVIAAADGMAPGRVYIATLLLIIPALAGARLLYVAAEWNTYRNNVRRIWNRNDGGYIMYGGLPLALLVSVPLLYVLHLSFARFWDVAIFTILVGMFFTRIGCLLHGCCAGRPTDFWFGLNLPNTTGVWKRRIPTQLLESAWALSLLAVGLLLRARVPFPGALFVFICLCYAFGRMLMEFARERQRPARLSVAHAFSVGIFLFCAGVLALYWRG